VLVEIRRYVIVPGRRDEFVAWFENTVVPAMEAAGMKIIGRYLSLDDPDVFFYLRGFADEAERDRQYAAFYDSDPWLAEWRDHALALEIEARVEVVTPTPGTPPLDG
jgi:hypothetical protein